MSPSSTAAAAVLLGTLAACWSDEDPRELADQDDFDHVELAQQTGPDCAAFHRIVDARQDTPPFSTLELEDRPVGALTCETRSEIEPPLLWGELVPATAHVCTFLEAPSTTPRDDVEATWAEISDSGFACFSDWEISAAGSRDDAEFGGHSTLTMESGDVPSVRLDDGSRTAPVVFDWRYQPDPAAVRPGHQIVFYVLEDKGGN